MTTKTLAYAKANAITSRSGAQAAAKHQQTLQRAQILLEAQGDSESRLAAALLIPTINAYSQNIRDWYASAAYRALKDALSV